MKKFALLGLLVLVLGMARAQDTIDEPYGRPPGYHLTYWFDDNCDFYCCPHFIFQVCPEIRLHLNLPLYITMLSDMWAVCRIADGTVWGIPRALWASG